jgi:hypothetical protein
MKYAFRNLATALAVLLALQLSLPPELMAQTRQLDTVKTQAIAELLTPSAGAQVTFAGFANPRYLNPNNNQTDATGFDVSKYNFITIAFEGTYAGNAGVAEQTNDPTGATGWFTVVGSNAAGTAASDVSATGTSTATAYVYPVLGLRMRERVTALTSGTMVARIAGTSKPWVRTGNLVGGTLTANGQATDNAAVAINPIRIGMKAVSANPAATTTGFQRDAIGTLVGALVVRPYSIPEAEWNYAAASGGIVNTTDVTFMTAGAAGIRNYLTRLDCKNASASVATEFVVKDGTTTVIWRTHLGIGERLTHTFPSPLKGTAATVMNAAAITTGAAVYCNAGGFQAP